MTMPHRSRSCIERTRSRERIEDALRRSGTAYKIIGGVRFYERKEVKDALAYLKLILSPQDDVSLRRVINVPARGIGKGVMESLEAVEIPLDADTDAHRCSPGCGQHRFRGRRSGASCCTRSSAASLHHARTRHSQRSAT